MIPLTLRDRGSHYFAETTHLLHRNKELPKLRGKLWPQTGKHARRLHDILIQDLSNRLRIVSRLPNQAAWTIWWNRTRKYRPPFSYSNSPGGPDER